MSKTKIDLFKNEVRRLLKVYNLLDWRVTIASGADESTYATINWNQTLSEEGGGRIAEIKYDEKWLVKAPADEIKRIALHEVLELRFCKLRDFSTQTLYSVSDREVDDEIHAIIHVFENIFLQEDNK